MPIRHGRGKPRPVGRRLLGAGPGSAIPPAPATFQIGGRQVAAIHGDGLTEPRLAGEAAAPRHQPSGDRGGLPRPAPGDRAPAGGLLSPHLGDHTHDEAQPCARRGSPPARPGPSELVQRRAVARARHHGPHPSPGVRSPGSGRQYLNPGAWFDGFRYAVATESGAELRRHSKGSG